MKRQFTGKIEDDVLKEFQQAIKDAQKTKKISQTKMGEIVGLSQPTISKVMNSNIKNWSEKLEKLFFYSKEEAEKGANAMLKKKIAQYLEIGGREKILGGILALLTEEQERHRASNAKSTKKAKSRKAASSTR